MRLHESASVQWPSDESWRVYWRTLVAGLERTTVDAAGLVQQAPEADVGPNDPDVRLVAGEHLQPGARYDMGFPGVTAVSIGAGVGDSPRGRLAHAQLRTVGQRGRATLDVDSLDEPWSLRVRSDLDHLGLDITFLRSRDGAADVDLRLDWLRVSGTLHVRRGGDGGDELVLDATVTGRRQWRPVLAPLLAVAGRLGTSVAREMVQDLAKTLTEIATDPAAVPLDPADRRERAVRQGAAIMTARASRVALAMEGRSWWTRRRPASWIRLLDLEPKPTWPPETSFESWPLTERRLLELYVRKHRSQPPTWVGDELLRQQQPMIENIRRWSSGPPAEELETMDPAVRQAWEQAKRPITDADFDLAWLSSPWSTVRRLSGKTGQSDSETAREVAEQLKAPGRRGPVLPLTHPHEEREL